MNALLATIQRLAYSTASSSSVSGGDPQVSPIVLGFHVFYIKCSQCTCDRPCIYEPHFLLKIVSQLFVATFVLRVQPLAVCNILTVSQYSLLWTHIHTCNSCSCTTHRVRVSYRELSASLCAQKLRNVFGLLPFTSTHQIVTRNSIDNSEVCVTYLLSIY